MTQVPSSKPERPRPARDEREPSAGTVLPWEQGRLFSLLFAGESKGDGQGLSHSRRASIASSDLALVEAFTEQLVPRLHAATQWPLQAAFFLPRLGRIDVSARREQGAWHVELAAEEEPTQLWLGSVRQACQDRMSASLGVPIQLSLAAAHR